MKTSIELQTGKTKSEQKNVCVCVCERERESERNEQTNVVRANLLPLQKKSRWFLHLMQQPFICTADEFDVVTNVVSVDYLSRPLEIFEEIFRVLKPGGRAIMSFSNRCFPTKVIAAWFPTNDLQHCGIVASYFKYSGFEDLKAIEVTKSWGDPMYVVEGRKPPSQTSTAQ